MADVSKADVYNTLIQNGVPVSAAKVLLAIAYPESNWNPKAEANTSREDSVGIFQINMKAHGSKLEKATGSSDSNVWRTWLQNPINNASMAAQVYKSSGLGAWSTYQNGSYLNYIKSSDSTSTAIIGQSDGATAAIDSSPSVQNTDFFSSAGSFFTRIFNVIIGLAMAALGIFIFVKTMPNGGAIKNG